MSNLPVTVSPSQFPGECVISISVGGITFEGDYADTNEGHAQGLVECAQAAGVNVEDCFLTFTAA